MFCLINKMDWSIVERQLSLKITACGNQQYGGLEKPESARLHLIFEDGKTMELNPTRFITTPEAAHLPNIFFGTLLFPKIPDKVVCINFQYAPQYSIVRNLVDMSSKSEQSVSGMMGLRQDYPAIETSAKIAAAPAPDATVHRKLDALLTEVRTKNGEVETWHKNTLNDTCCTVGWILGLLIFAMVAAIFPFYKIMAHLPVAQPVTTLPPAAFPCALTNVSYVACFDTAVGKIDQAAPPTGVDSLPMQNAFKQWLGVSISPYVGESGEELNAEEFARDIKEIRQHVYDLRGLPRVTIWLRTFSPNKFGRIIVGLERNVTMFVLPAHRLHDRAPVAAKLHQVRTQLGVEAIDLDDVAPTETIHTITKLSEPHFVFAIQNLVTCNANALRLYIASNRELAKAVKPERNQVVLTPDFTPNKVIENLQRACLSTVG